MNSRFPIDRLQQAHCRHYRTGTWASFIDWFERSGYGDVLRLPWLCSGDSHEINAEITGLNLTQLRGLRFNNITSSQARLQLRCRLEDGPVTVPELFARFVRSTAHTHLWGDFRHYTHFFGASYTSPRFILFDGSGTCLLLGAMFQSMAARCCNEHVKLHYSHTASRELTHVFASWQGNFVDPDQKTFVPMDVLDQSALYGYLFQQLGVSAYQLFQAIPESKRNALFRKMTLDYFAFYDDSRKQYMYQPEQSVEVISAFFKSAREDHCTDLDLYADDFSWKHLMLNEAAQYGLGRPYFLARQSEPVDITILPKSQFEIGLLNSSLPEEAALLSALFFGRVPGTLTFLGTTYPQKVDVPEIPWMIVFDLSVQSVVVNDVLYTPWVSACGHFRLLGMGDLESCLGDMPSLSGYAIELGACAGKISVVLPMNALAVGAGQIGFFPSAEIDVTAWVAA